MSMTVYWQEENYGVVYEHPSIMHGGGWISYERNVNPGTMRAIKGVISKAWLVSKRGFFRKPRIHWISVEPGDLRKVGIAERPEAGASQEGGGRG